MRSIKVDADTDALLTGLRGRLGSSKDEVIRELVRRYNAALADALTAGDRLKRVEEMLVQLTLQKQEDDDGGDGDGTPPTYDVK
jgi:hypothetical protein